MYWKYAARGTHSPCAALGRDPMTRQVEAPCAALEGRPSHAASLPEQGSPGDWLSFRNQPKHKP